jgi:hypothetical protein
MHLREVSDSFAPIRPSLRPTSLLGIGIRFYLGSNIELYALGAWDENQDGMCNNIQVPPDIREIAKSYHQYSVLCMISIQRQLLLDQ